MKVLVVIICCGLLSLFGLTADAQQHVSKNNNVKETTMEQATRTFYKTVEVDGLEIFYREAGPANAPVILLLHGFPSSSRMFNSLMNELTDHYHLIAPDYPGFGHSDYPSTSVFHYTFDNIAKVMANFTKALGLQHYHLYLQDYGGPIGLRLAMAHPEKLESLIIQNAVSHEEGLSPLWEKRKAYWKDSTANKQALISNFTSAEATRQRHVGTSPHPERIDPDTWTDELAWLNSPEVLEAQLDLFYDYQNNVAMYPKFQVWLRSFHPHLLVLWGKYDPSFTIAGAYAYKNDVPDAQVHILDAGHFALDEASKEIAAYVRGFLK